MKSFHYIAATVSFYRRIIDGWEVEPEDGLALLSRIPNRGYSQGFMKGDVNADDYQHDMSRSHGESIFVGNILEGDPEGRTVLEVRNKITAGETLEVLTPDGVFSEMTMPESMTTTEGATVTVVNNSKFLVLDTPLPAYTLLRRLKSLPQIGGAVDVNNSTG